MPFDPRDPEHLEALKQLAAHDPGIHLPVLLADGSRFSDLPPDEEVNGVELTSAGAVRFVSAACEAVPVLIAEVERLQAQSSTRSAAGGEMGLGLLLHAAEENDSLRALLRENQWAGRSPYFGNVWPKCCYICGGLDPDQVDSIPDYHASVGKRLTTIGHGPDCRLGAELKE